MKVRICCRFPLRTSAIGFSFWWGEHPFVEIQDSGPGGPKQTPVRWEGRSRLSHPLRRVTDMAYEQVFEESVDTEHLFVLQCQESEQVFGEGEAMSVALELEY